MKAIHIALARAALFATPSCVLAADEPQASIPFVTQDMSILGWQADGNAALWIQDSHRHWYYIKLFAPCNGLETAVRIGIEPRTGNTLDRFGSIVVPRAGRCQIISLTKSSAPPERTERN